MMSLHALHVALDVTLCPSVGSRVLLEQQQGGQRFESLLAGGFGAGLSLGAVGQVEVFQLGVVPRVSNAVLQRVGQLAQCLDGGQDGFLAPFGFLQLLVTVADVFYLHLVQSSGNFLAVAADEGDGSPVVQQGKGLAHLLVRQGERCGYQVGKQVVHVSDVWMNKSGQR